MIYHVLKFSGPPPKVLIEPIGNFGKIKWYEFKDIIAFKIFKGRYCIGNFKNGMHEKCRTKIEKGFQCDNCFKKDKLNFCAICNGERCLLSRKICKGHFVYLATFGSVLKVGVTSINRFPKRVTEQGADFATKIAVTDDGLEARKIEKMISEEFSIIDKINSKLKQKLIYKKHARNLGREILVKAYYHIIDKINKIYQLPLEIIDLSEYYEEPEEEPEPLILEQGALEGKVIGYKGSMMIIKIGKRTFSFNCRSLVSKLINLEMS